MGVRGDADGSTLLLLKRSYLLRLRLQMHHPVRHLS